MEYTNEGLYITSKTGALAKIAAIDACIDVLLATVLSSVENADMSEYMLNDGQTTIKKIYRSPEQVIKSVGALRSLRQLYINDVNPRSVRMVDAKNISANKGYGSW